MEAALQLGLLADRAGQIDVKPLELVLVIQVFERRIGCLGGELDLFGQHRSAQQTHGGDQQQTLFHDSFLIDSISMHQEFGKPAGLRGLKMAAVPDSMIRPFSR